MNLILILLTIAAGFGAVIYILLTQVGKSKPEDTSAQDKKDELLTRMLENMNNNQTHLQNLLNERLREVHGTMDNRLKGVESTMNDRLQHVQNQLLQSSDSLNKHVNESSKNLNSRLDNAAEVIRKVQGELSTMSEIGRNMKDLQDFLKSPKLRGNIGEQVLKELLSQMLPTEKYSLQYEFKTGDKVDAILRLEQGLVCVDSKFPMENFNAMMQRETQEERDSYKKEFIKNVKKHIDDISKKYILPDENTVDFAIMYIPSEAIYYEVVVNSSEQMGKYAWDKRVLPVSPNIFYSYLKAVMIGLEGQRLQAQSKQIMAVIRGIKGDSVKFSESLRLMTKHFNNARNSVDDVNKNFDRLQGKINTLDQTKQVLEDTASTANLIMESATELDGNPLDDSGDLKLL